MCSCSQGRIRPPPHAGAATGAAKFEGTYGSTAGKRAAPLTLWCMLQGGRRRWLWRGRPAPGSAMPLNACRRPQVGALRLRMWSTRGDVNAVLPLACGRAFSLGAHLF